MTWDQRQDDNLKPAFADRMVSRLIDVPVEHIRHYYVAALLEPAASDQGPVPANLVLSQLTSCCPVAASIAPVVLAGVAADEDLGALAGLLSVATGMGVPVGARRGNAPFTPQPAAPSGRPYGMSALAAQLAAEHGRVFPPGMAELIASLSGEGVLCDCAATGFHVHIGGVTAPAVPTGEDHH